MPHDVVVALGIPALKKLHSSFLRIFTIIRPFLLLILLYLEIIQQFSAININTDLVSNFNYTNEIRGFS